VKGLVLPVGLEGLAAIVGDPPAARERSGAFYSLSAHQSAAAPAAAAARPVPVVASLSQPRCPGLLAHTDGITVTFKLS
jgi:hypothetical protein